VKLRLLPNKNRGSRIRRQWLSGTLAAVWTALIGVILLQFDIGDGVRRLSYDLPFKLRKVIPSNEAVLVLMDEVSHKGLDQPFTAPWDRSLHARLVDQLVASGAKAIVFDILFTDASTNAAADADFARAIKASGRVLLCGNFHPASTTPGVIERPWNELPYEPFRVAATGWGNANFAEDSDFGVRHFFPTVREVSGQNRVEWLPVTVARLVNSSESPVQAPNARVAWLNYYGPPGTLPARNYLQSLFPDGVEPGFFKDKIVFVGGRLSADFSGKGKDEFRTPYAFWGAGFAPGVEIHATAALNLLHGNWLTRFPETAELAMVLAVAAIAGFGLMRFMPLTAVGIALGVVAVISAGAHLVVWSGNVWFAWLIPVIEVSTALFCSIVANSVHLYVEKRLLEQSLAAHLSPKIVKRLLNDSSLREVGGSQQQVSILFSDLANFSRISEAMQSDDLVRMMNKYFDIALQCIHKTDGTVVKLIGDAIFAIWNAPVEQADHRERACRSALLLREKIVEFEAAHLTLPLRTRVGLHAGDACVGNIGSSMRFDYTALGDNVNLTSRLEGLNKFLGTSVLATREVQRAVENTLVWRSVGHFQLKGLSRVVEIYELIGSIEKAEASRSWREQFAQALGDLLRRRFDSAADKFQRTIELRRAVEPEITTGTTLETADGPSRFYLQKIEEFKKFPPPRNWIGEIEVKDK
jgi:adenylate cyclase